MISHTRSSQKSSTTTKSQGACGQRYIPSVLIGLFATVLSAAVSAQGGGWTFEGTDVTRHNVYAGAFLSRWTFEPESGLLGADSGTSMQSAGGGVFIGAQLSRQLTLETRAMTGFSEDSDDDLEAELEHSLSALARLNFDLGLPTRNELYIMGGLTTYTVEISETNNDSSLTRSEMAPAAGVGITHRVSPSMWIFAEYFNQAVFREDDLDSIGLGGMVRF